MTVLLAFLLGAGITYICCLWLVPVLRRAKIKKEVREDVPERHLAKAGTPSMGGIAFIIGAALSSMIFSPRLETLLPVLALVSYGAIGFADDWVKARGGRGFKARYKLACQIALALLLTVAAMREVGVSSEVYSPLSVDRWSLGGWYLVFAALLITLSSNSVNITDGLDGLAAGLSLLSTLGLLGVSLLTGQVGVSVFCAALVGACVGFLPFNIHPAKVFMGDTGSLALGAAVAVAAILLKVELLLPFLILVCLIDTLTVVLQVAYFQATKRLIGQGRRIFLRTPIHHAFELRGWSEWKVVTSFWAVGLLGAGLGQLLWWKWGLKP